MRTASLVAPPQCPWCQKRRKLQSASAFTAGDSGVNVSIADTSGGVLGASIRRWIEPRRLMQIYADCHSRPKEMGGNFCSLVFGSRGMRLQKKESGTRATPRVIRVKSSGCPSKEVERVGVAPVPAPGPWTNHGPGAVGRQWVALPEGG